jgi:hypothetical protein
MSKYRNKLAPDFIWREAAAEPSGGQQVTLEYRGVAVGCVRMLRDGWVASLGSDALPIVAPSMVVPSVGRGKAWLSRSVTQRLVSVRRALDDTGLQQTHPDR